MSKDKLCSMIRNDEMIIMRAIALCFKPYLKPEEALIYCNLGRTQFSNKCAEHMVFKSTTGYYKREELDKMMEGEETGIKLKEKSRK